MRFDEAELKKALCDAGSYRDFLRRYFQVTGKSYAEIARRAGFSSRSYPRDVTEGRRRLTTKALPVLTRGLQLESRLSELFQLLYFSEYPEEFATVLPAGRSADVSERIRKRLEQARKRASVGVVRTRAPGVERLETPEDLRELLEGHLFEVLAALGEPEKGSTLEDLRRMTGLDRASLARILDLCVREGMAGFETRANRYFPTSAHLTLTGIPRNELIRSIFLRVAERARAAAAGPAYLSESALFYSSAISVSRESLPRLKRELREVLLRFADATVETEAGRELDTVAYVVGSIFEARLGE